MAAFFKEYHRQRQEQNQQITEQPKEREFTAGEGVTVKSQYIFGEDVKLYFADIINDTFCLLSDNKKDALKGVGYIYPIDRII